MIFVDESHRLSKRKNLTGYKVFDDVDWLPADVTLIEELRNRM